MTYKKYSSAGLCLTLLAILLAGCSNDPGSQGIQSARLPPCSSEGSIFAEQPYRNWKTTYHGGVSRVVEAHLQDINNVTSLKLQCTADDYSQLLPASADLRQIAGMLPMWRRGNRMGTLSETDMGSVLLEFLRVYECSLNERKEFLTIHIPEEETDVLSYAELMTKTAEAEKEIDTELRISRPALERTLSLVGGYDRLRPLSLDIECIKRASLDLRNVLGLASDVSACLPRIWDAKGSLRDLAE